ncbi:MarR family winged helix-turn-helix transcriptional regulator [Azospirillum thermophilum]|uniref:MarR family transcriptional regulator n=1 Tax=Azospirillum thermophilum TaxID=2202148 RepID=A0A2S2CMC3_9PROT|nr:MarR family transcriptional regulator [Azospirillum thermophilum]AWK85457.1 MarR family transcriptional regulator [Azospirillum thermophilum]
MPAAVRTSKLAGLFEHAARLIHGAGHAHGLYPAQWTALRYFSETGRDRAPTVAGLMRFQNMAMSPVARTVRSMVEKGLLERRPNPQDRRADLIDLTDEGRRLLELDPRQRLEALLDKVPASQKVVVAEALQILIDGLLDETDRSAPPPDRS